MTRSAAPYRVLFLCTGNTARSILAEAVLNHLGKGRFIALSAGSHPKGVVNPFAIDRLEREGVSTEGLRSKSWDEFAGAGVEPIDLVITVCDNAAGEVCPVWPGHPVTAHWGLPDPAAVEGPDSAREKAFQDAYQIILRRIRMFLELPAFDSDEPAFRRRLAEIGRS